MFDNIGNLMKLRSAWGKFSSMHPKFAAFLNDAGRSGLPDGSVLEIHIEYPDGRHISTNMRVTPEDRELIESLRSLKS